MEAEVATWETIPPYAPLLEESAGLALLTTEFCVRHCPTMAELACSSSAFPTLTIKPVASKMARRPLTLHIKIFWETMSM